MCNSLVLYDSNDLCVIKRLYLLLIYMYLYKNSLSLGRVREMRDNDGRFYIDDGNLDSLTLSR